MVYGNILKNNKLLYSVSYEHFTNSIENYFSMMKSRLNKLDGLTHKELKTNINKVIKYIPKEKYENIIIGVLHVQRCKTYVKKVNMLFIKKDSNMATYILLFIKK